MKDILEKYENLCKSVLGEARRGKKGASPKANVEKMMDMMSEISRLAMATGKLPAAKDEERSLQLIIGNLQKAYDVARRMKLSEGDEFDDGEDVDLLDEDTKVEYKYLKGVYQELGDAIKDVEFVRNSKWYKKDAERDQQKNIDNMLNQIKLAHKLAKIEMFGLAVTAGR